MRHEGGDSDVTGVLLAGGRSARMGGQEKALLELSGKSMLAHVIAIASDHAIEDRNRPVFALDDVEGIAAFIEKATNLARQSRLE